MPTPDKKSHWSSLANMLGAKVTDPPAPEPPVETPVAAAPSPAAPETASPIASTPLPRQKPEPVAPAPAKASPPASEPRDHWGSLLGALGLRTPEPEPEPEVEAELEPTPTPAPQPVETLLGTPNRGPNNLWELLGERPPEGEITRPAAHEELSVEVGGNDLTLGEEDDEVPVPRMESAPRGPDRRRISEDRPRGDAPRPRDEERGPRRRRRRRRRNEPGVESADPTDRPIRARGDDDLPPYDDAEDFVPPAVYSDDDETDEVGELLPPVRSEESREEGDRKRRPRRRRRRRGGRTGTESGAEVRPVERSAPDLDDLDDLDEPIPYVEEDLDEPRAPTREPMRAGPPRSRRNEVPATLELDEEDDDEDDGSAEFAEHRAIPTWQDAVGVVVGANMEARARNPNGGGRGGRGRGGRGRGGGGRGR